MQFPPIKKGAGGGGNPAPAGPGQGGNAGEAAGAGNQYVKNIKKNPQNQTQIKPGVVVSGLGV